MSNSTNRTRSDSNASSQPSAQSSINQHQPPAAAGHPHQSGRPQHQAPPVVHARPPNDVAAILAAAAGAGGTIDPRLLHQVAMRNQIIATQNHHVATQMAAQHHHHHRTAAQYEHHYHHHAAQQARHAAHQAAQQQQREGGGQEHPSQGHHQGVSSLRASPPDAAPAGHNPVPHTAMAHPHQARAPHWQVGEGGSETLRTLALMQSLGVSRSTTALAAAVLPTNALPKTAAALSAAAAAGLLHRQPHPPEGNGAEATAGVNGAGGDRGAQQQHQQSSLSILNSLGHLGRPSSTNPPRHRNYVNQNPYAAMVNNESISMGAAMAQHLLEPLSHPSGASSVNNNTSGSPQNRTNMLQAYGEENPLFYERLVQILGKAGADEMVKEAVDETIKEADNIDGNESGEVAELEGGPILASAAGQKQQANVMQGGIDYRRHNEQDVISIDDTSDEEDNANQIQQKLQPKPQLAHMPSPSRNSPKNTPPFILPTAQAPAADEMRAAVHAALIAKATTTSSQPQQAAERRVAHVAQVVAPGGRPRVVFSPLISTVKTAGAAAAQQSKKRKADEPLPRDERAASIARGRAVAATIKATGSTSIDLTEDSQASVPNPLNPLSNKLLSLYGRRSAATSVLSNYARKRTTGLSLSLDSLSSGLDKGAVPVTLKATSAMSASTTPVLTPHAITAAIAAAQEKADGDSNDDDPPGFDQFKSDPEFCKLIFDAAEKHKNDDTTKEGTKSLGGVFVRGLLNIKDTMLNKSLFDDSERSFRDYVRDVISPYFSIPPNLAESEGQWEAYVHISSDNINEFARNVVYQRRKSMKSAVELAFYELRNSNQSNKTDPENNNATTNEKIDLPKTPPPSAIDNDRDTEKDLRIKELEEELLATKLNHAKKISATEEQHLDKTKDCEARYTKFVSKLIKSHRKEVNDMRKDMKIMQNVHSTFLESFAEASMEELRNNCESPSL